MVIGYWYYPSNRYEEEGNKGIDVDETEYDTDEYSWLLPVIDECKKRGRKPINSPNYEYIDHLELSSLGKKSHKKVRAKKTDVKA